MTRATRNPKTLLVALVGAAALTWSACTIKSQETPPLTGPSGLGTSITVEVSPDVLSQDGRSQSLVTVTARNQNGALFPNLTLRAEIQVNGVTADFGSLSARTLVTDANGKVTFVYTAPSTPTGVTVETFVAIAVTPLGTDAANATPRLASIRLVPPGSFPPPSGLVPAFKVQPAAPSDHQNVLFDASTSTSAPNNPIQSYQWSFGDGRTGNGVTVLHSYDLAGTYVVTLTIFDSFNHSAQTSQTVTVLGTPNPSASFSSSPTDPLVNQQINFNGSASTAPQGHRIVNYTWDFGDGTPLFSSGSPIASHSYTLPRTYTVTLVVTDDTGKTGTQSNGVQVK
jgi:chitodextrinase